MTVGIAYNNGKEAIAITDSRASKWGRQGDHVNKIGIFEAPEYVGAVFGAGLGDTVSKVVGYLGDYNGKTLDDFAESIHGRLRKDSESQQLRLYSIRKKEIDLRAAMIDSPVERKKFVASQVAMAWNEMIDIQKGDSTSFVVVAYDKNSKRIRQVGINGHHIDFVERGEIPIGSGADGADFYATTTLTGLDNSKLSPTELAFFALNAYSSSTANQGVGGIPKIVTVSDKGSQIMPRSIVLPLVNLSGAYLSETSPGRLTADNAVSLVGEILSGKADLEKIADLANTDAQAFKEFYIPYSSWQERANSTRYSHS